MAPKLVIREKSNQGSQGESATGVTEDLQLREKMFSIDRKMHALQQVRSGCFWLLLRFQHVLRHTCKPVLCTGLDILTLQQPPRPLPPVKRATSVPVRSRVASSMKSGRPATPASSSATASSSNFLDSHLLNQVGKRDTHPLALIGLAGGGSSGDMRCAT